MNNARFSKRQRQALLFFTYGFMTLATVVISAICILLVLGYRFDIKSNRLEQGSLVQFRSIPDGSVITLDGVKLGFTTPGKLEVSAGQHTVTYKKAKYLEWTKTITVDAGELRWLNYARLVPEKITTKPIVAANDVSEGLPTPDRKFLATVSAARPGEVAIYDLRDLTKVTSKVYTIPATLITTPDQASTYQIVEWDSASRYLLFARTTGATTEYLRLDRTTDSGSVVNLTKEFSLPFAQPHFSGTSGNVYYVLTGSDLRRVDLGNKSISAPLVAGVESYQLYHENDIAFVAVRADKKIAGVYISSKETIVRSYAPTDVVMVDLTEYFSDYYLAVSRAERVEIVKDPTQATASSTSAHYAVFDTAFVPTKLDFASSGRFLTALSGRAYQLYDLETDSKASVNMADSDRTMASPRWIDDYYLADVVDGSVRIYEFDGANTHTITNAQPSLPVFFSDNGNFLISFGLQDGKIVMQSSQMVVN
jgi:hypothetical protein